MSVFWQLRWLAILLSFVRIPLKSLKIKVYDFLIPPAPSVEICRQNDPNIDECLKRAMNDFILTICGDNLPVALDPFDFDSISFDLGIPFFGGSVSAKDVKFFGLSDSTVTSVSSDITPNSLAVNATSFYPIIFMTGIGTLELQLGSYSLNVSAPFNITLRNVNVDYGIVGATENINGTDYLVVETASFVPQPQDIELSIANVGKLWCSN